MDADDYSEPWKKVDGVIEWLHFSPNYVIFQIHLCFAFYASSSNDIWGLGSLPSRHYFNAQY
jgi:hypothetical protein